MFIAVVLFILAVILLIFASPLMDTDGGLGAMALIFGFLALLSGIYFVNSISQQSVSGTYATTKTISDGTYLVRGQFEDPLKRKVLLIQGADGKIRALVVQAFVPPETKVVEIDG
ncbi:MAG: hypothetical protein Q7S36_03100, partial [Candidatus Liptonbacteria bacterium]|nr:hypothetical protein [Candidatus Liptonbacteria bacterium]